ncbi:hypothetical protein IFM89_003592 [Coptis chinensis]|uniref:Cupin type-1 domain-containing protein n=1 Tax=Coptis chinensis TaxID=261450 RepID=A0A835I2J1_9MAGN|nr:hypothetical protein IFM89_003592 [Coptis chinensis]
MWTLAMLLIYLAMPSEKWLKNLTRHLKCVNHLPTILFYKYHTISILLFTPNYQSTIRAQWQRLSLLLCFSVCFLVLFHAQARQQPQPQSQSQSQGQSQCQVQNLDALEPARRIQSEAGVTEHWDENNEQLECAGVAVTRHTIQPRGLLLPHFNNAPKLTYIIQGIRVSTQTARRLKGENNNRGNIVRVENGLQVIRPPRRQEQEEQDQEQEQEWGANGVEESICYVKLRENLDEPSRADVYNPNAGRINRLNGRKLPILRYLRLNAERGVLYRDSALRALPETVLTNAFRISSEEARRLKYNREEKEIFAPRNEQFEGRALA